MKPRDVIATAQVPGGPPLRLVQHDRDFIIMLDRNELMSSRMSGSEVALGVGTCQRLRDRAAPRLLVGGYGMGFTLRAVLGALGPGAQVTVAELVPDIIDWARGPMHDLTAGGLDDPRVVVRIGDVGEVMADGDYDAILLDVDNGPDGVVRQANNRLYSPGGLATARAALNADGVLAIWSAAPDAAFAKLLAQSGFAVEETRVRARANGKGATHIIWYCRRR